MKRKSKRRTWAAAASGLALCLAHTAFAERSLAITGTLYSAYPESIDMMRLDHSSGSLLLAQGNVLTVLGADGGLRGELALESRPTSFVIAQGSGKALLALGHGNTLAIVDLNSAAIDATLQSAIEFPSVTAFDPASGNFLAASDRNPGLAVIDPGGRGQQVIDTEGPIASLEATGRGWIFGAAAGESAVYVFDSLSGVALGEFPAPGCRYPSDLALDDAERRIYLTCTNGLFLALDSDAGVILNRQEVEPGDLRLALRILDNRIIQAIVVAEGKGVHVLEGRIAVSGVKGVYGGLESPRDVQVEPDTGRIFLATGSNVSVVDLQ